LGIAAAQVTSAFKFQFTEKAGPYTVGLKVIEQYDRPRSFQIEGDSSNKTTAAQGPRPLQTLVWYPSEESSREAMTFGDYGALIKTETSFGKPVEHGKPQSFVESFMQGDLPPFSHPFITGDSQL